MNKCGSLALILITIVLIHDWSGAKADNSFYANPPSAPELVLESGHSKSVRAIVFSPNNSWIATASADSTIRIWETMSGRELRTLSGHVGALRTLAISPNGQTLASGGIDSTVRLWDVETGREIWRFDSQRGVVEAVAFSPDGKKLAFGGTTKAVELRDTNSGELIWSKIAHADSVTALAFSPDSTVLASGGADKRINLWEVSKATPVRKITDPSGSIRDLRFNSKGEILGSLSDDKTIRSWRTATGREASRSVRADNSLFGLYFTIDHRLIYVDSNRSVGSTGEKSVAKTNGEIGKCAGGTGITEAAAFNAEGNLLAFSNGDGTVSICEVASGAERTRLDNSIVGSYKVDISPDQRFIASAGFDNTVKLWDLLTGQSLAPLTGHTGRVTCVVFRPEAQQVISGSVDHTIRVWGTLESKEILLLSGHSGAIQGLAIGRSGKLLASASSDQTIGLWDLESPSRPRYLKGHVGEVTSVSIDGDETRLASGGQDGILRLWDVNSGNILQSMDSGGQLDVVSFSPDGRTVAFAGHDHKIRVWDIRSGTVVATMAGHTGRIYSLGFSSDGNRLVSAGQDRTMRIWSMPEKRELSNSTDHRGVVYSAAFSPDQRFVVSGSDDGSLILWKSDLATPIARLMSIKGGTDWLVVTPNGFFDGSPDAWGQLFWRFENKTFSFNSVEVFFSEFFTPGLLGDLIKQGKPPIGSEISIKDRRQPQIELRSDSQAESMSDRSVKVRITITDGGAGAKDVRLFRNGSLVKVWRGSVLIGDQAVSLEASIPRVAGNNSFMAYAFNGDNIKSKNATLNISGDKALARKGVFYILAVGINNYANPDFNLNFAVADARDVGDELRKQQAKLDIYERVELIGLNDADATKAAIIKKLGDLAHRIEPEDVLLIYFAGHGIAHQNRFFLVPYDLGYKGSRATMNESGLDQILRHGISDEELEMAVESIDSRQIVFVIDACNSGQALESEEARRGPMNSKGLAQLAYEKGMYILTAAQSYQAAKEATRLGHGFLTFALIEEGLRKSAADIDPKDGQILLREWLNYSIGRVPQINEEAITERKLEREKNKSTAARGQADLQRPRVFYRREIEARPLLVARAVGTRE